MALKASLTFELYGENFRATVDAHFKYGNKMTMNPKLIFHAMSKTPPEYWVKEIIGINECGVFLTKKIKLMKDYANASSIGSRGVIAQCILSAEKCYEVKKPISWTKTETFYCTVKDGEVSKISKDEVMMCLKNI